jgi:hypothetical protein
VLNYCSLLVIQEGGYIPDKLVKAERLIAAYPYDTEAWSVLIRDCQVYYYFFIAYLLFVLVELHS